jgi:L-ribulokinase
LNNLFWCRRVTSPAWAQQFCFLAAALKNISSARRLPFRIFQPNLESVSVYQELYTLYRRLYFAFGEKHSAATNIGDIMPEIRRIGAEVRALQ